LERRGGGGGVGGGVGGGGRDGWGFGGGEGRGHAREARGRAPAAVRGRDIEALGREHAIGRERDRGAVPGCVTSVRAGRVDDIRGRRDRDIGVRVALVGNDRAVRLPRGDGRDLDRERVLDRAAGRGLARSHHVRA